MCGRNIVEEKVEYKVWSKPSRTQSVGRNIVEQKVEYKVWSKRSRTKSRVECVFET